MNKLALLMLPLAMAASVAALSARADDAGAIQANCAAEHPGDAGRQAGCYEANMQAMRQVLAVAREHPEITPEHLSAVREACEAESAPGDYVTVAACFARELRSNRSANACCGH